MNILVSGCLLGLSCRYDGKENGCEAVKRLMDQHTLIPVCPEQLGGMATPRLPAERVGEKVLNREGGDVTGRFQYGAEQVLMLAKLYNCRYAVLKERSPSCGKGRIYDGTFSGALKEGDGVTAGLLMKNGIQVIGEGEVADFEFRW